MKKFIDEVIMLGSSRADGVHWLPIDGLDRAYAVDNGNAIYVFLPRTHDPRVIENVKQNLDTIKLIKSSSPLIDMEYGYRLFGASRAHTQQAMLLLNSVFSAAMANPELFHDG